MCTQLNEFAQKAINYKRRIAGNYMLIEPDKIKTKLQGETYAVTRKIDGLMQLVLFDNGKVRMAGTGGVVRENMPCLEEFASVLDKKGIKTALIAAELYGPNPQGRPRCYDVNTALGENGDVSRCHLAPFDLLELNGEEFFGSYTEKHRQLTELFSGTERVSPVELRMAYSKDEVKEIFDEWVTGENAEGLVIHSESPIIWKLKPRHSIDAVITGYSLENGRIRDLLMAVRDENGLFRVFGKCSNGLTEEERTSLLHKLTAAKSNYIYVDDHQLAFQMVIPEVILELSVIELLSENSAGKAKKNQLICWENNMWNSSGIVPGVSALGMKIERFRPDKSSDVSDIRSSQLSDLVPFSAAKIPDKLPKSTLLDRRVFRKTSGSKVYIQKFLIWASNKADFGYGKYIFFHTDYSSDRKEPLKRDIKVAASVEKIREFMKKAIAENIKKNYIEI